MGEDYTRTEIPTIKDAHLAILVDVPARIRYSSRGKGRSYCAKLLESDGKYVYMATGDIDLSRVRLKDMSWFGRAVRGVRRFRREEIDILELFRPRVRYRIS